VTLTRAELERRIAECEGTGPGAPLPPQTSNTVEQLLTALERGDVRAAERGGDGEWRAVPWVKRGILLAFRAGRIVDMSPPGLGTHPAFTFYDKNTVPPR
jgi:2,3,4,5-tetrahydropyridine-2,6-dicarboxylate N-succinyltransferase